MLQDLKEIVCVFVGADMREGYLPCPCYHYRLWRVKQWQVLLVSDFGGMVGIEGRGCQSFVHAQNYSFVDDACKVGRYAGVCV